MKKRPGMVIFSLFIHCLVLMRNSREEVEATFAPAASSMRDKSHTTVDLPVVPVTPTTISLREGWLASHAESHARKKCHKEMIGEGMRERIYSKSLISNL